MALLVRSPHGVGWTSPSCRSGVDSFASPFMDPERPLYPPPQRHNGNRDTNRQGEIPNINPRPINPATGQPISKRAAKRRRARARKAAAREAETRQRQQNAQNEGQAPQPRVRTNERGQQANSGWASQRRSQQNWFIPHSSNYRVPSNAVRVTLFPHQSEQTSQVLAATRTTAPSTRRNHGSRLNLLPPSETTIRLIPSGTHVNRLQYDDDGDFRDNENIEDITRRALARMGGLFPVAHQVTSRDTVTEERHVRPERLPRHRVANSPCSICLDVPDEFPHLQPTSRCAHPPTICATCLEQHISHAVQSQGSTTLTCPNLGCRQMMEYADVVRGARNNQACLDRFEALLLRRMLENEINFVWCKSPTCGWGQIHEGGDDALIVICQACHARSCFTHDVPWHSGLTCEQYSTQLEETRRGTEEASQAYIGRHAKACPNPSCGRRIEKSEGCDHMTCRRPAGCGHEFCWSCLADYNRILLEGNHRHEPTCQYYVAIETRAPAQAQPRLQIPEEPNHARRAQRIRPTPAEARLAVEEIRRAVAPRAPLPPLFRHPPVHAPPILAPAASAPSPADAHPANPPANAIPAEAPSTRLPVIIAPPTIVPPTIVLPRPTTAPPDNSPPPLPPLANASPPTPPPPEEPRTPPQSRWSWLLGRRNTRVQV